MDQSETGPERSGAADAGALRSRLRALEEEVALLRRKLADTPARVSTLEERLLEAKGQLSAAVSQNEKLTYTLREAREHIAALREEVDKLTQPPSAYGTFLSRNDDGTADVHASGRKMRVALHPDLSETELVEGSEVVLNESYNIVLARGPETSGEVVTLNEGAGRRLPGHGDGPRRRGAHRGAGRRPARRAAALGRQPAARHALQHRARAPAAPRGGRPAARRGARRHLRGHRRPRHPDRADHRRRGAAVPAPGTCSAPTTCRRPRASCCTGRPAAARR